MAFVGDLPLSGCVRGFFFLFDSPVSVVNSFSVWLLLGFLLLGLHFIVLATVWIFGGHVWFQWVVCVYFLSIVVVLVSSGLFSVLFGVLFIQGDGCWERAFVLFLLFQLYIALVFGCCWVSFFGF